MNHHGRWLAGAAGLLAGGAIALAFAAIQFRAALQQNMRAPSGSALGWLATQLMGKVNFPTIEDAVRRLGVADGECVVELGAGHGVGVRALAAPGREGLDVWAVEISARFRATLLATTALSPSRVVDADAKAMPFLASGSVDKVLAVNVVYFLLPAADVSGGAAPRAAVQDRGPAVRLQVQPASSTCCCALRQRRAGAGRGGDEGSGV